MAEPVGTVTFEPEVASQMSIGRSEVITTRTSGPEGYDRQRGPMVKQKEIDENIRRKDLPRESLE
jgi:hypothetical protein